MTKVRHNFMVLWKNYVPSHERMITSSFTLHKNVKKEKYMTSENHLVPPYLFKQWSVHPTPIIFKWAQNVKNYPPPHLFKQWTVHPLPLIFKWTVSIWLSCRVACPCESVSRNVPFHILVCRFTQRNGNQSAFGDLSGPFLSDQLKAIWNLRENLCHCSYSFQLYTSVVMVVHQYYKVFALLALPPINDTPYKQGYHLDNCKNYKLHPICTHNGLYCYRTK